MNHVIGFHHLWLFYVLAYAIALPMQTWANKKRGEPFDDPEFLFQGWMIFALAMVWLVGGFIVSLFVPLASGATFAVGWCVYTGGLVVAALTAYSFAYHRGLVTTGIHRYSRNPGYVAWAAVIFGLTLMGWSESFWSIVFLIYFLLTLPYFHWTVLMEENFLAHKYGGMYREYLRDTSRYLGASKPRRG